MKMTLAVIELQITAWFIFTDNTFSIEECNQCYIYLNWDLRNNQRHAGIVFAYKSETVLQPCSTPNRRLDTT